MRRPSFLFAGVNNDDGRCNPSGVNMAKPFVKGKPGGKKMTGGRKMARGC